MKFKFKLGLGTLAILTGSTATPLIAASCSCKPEVKQVALTFDAGTHGKITQGLSTIKVNVGTKFSEINTPVVIPNTGYIFNGWNCSTEIISADTTVTATYKTYDDTQKVTVTFDLDGGVLLTGSLTRTVNKGTLLKNINTPTFEYKDTSKIFNGWDHDGNTEINENTTIKATWRDVVPGEITHTLNFCIDGTEKLESGSLQIQISNNTTWQQVRANANFPIITNVGHKISDVYGYYVPSSDGHPENAQIINDQTVFNFEISKIINININWVKISPEQWVNVKFNVDSEKGEITAGSSVVQAFKGVTFENVTKPIVKGKTDGTKRNVFKGWADLDGNLIDDSTIISNELTVYAKFEEVESTTYTYTVKLSAGACGYFPSGTTTTLTATYTKEEKPEKVTFADIFAKCGQPTNPTPYEGWKFIGWNFSTSDEVQEGLNIITALYEYQNLYQLAFVKEDDGVTIEGAASVLYEESTIWNEFNKPTATKAGCTFTNWAIKIADENYYPIIGDCHQKTIKELVQLAFGASQIPDIISIVPSFTEDAKFTNVIFQNNQKDMGTITGNSIIVIENTTFGEINKPEIKSYPGAEWDGWYCNGTKLTSSSKLTGDEMIIEPRWNINLDHLVSVKANKASTVTLDFSIAASTVEIEVSVDGGKTFTAYTKESTASTSKKAVISVDKDSTIYLRRNYESTTRSLENFNIKIEGDADLDGNILSLFDWKGKDVTYIQSNNYCKGLFAGSTGLRKVSDNFLANVTINFQAKNCYKEMFKDCTNLIKTPKLNSYQTSEGCYESMFEGCTSLVIPTEMPRPAGGLSIGCYKRMFKGCTSLLSTPIFSESTAQNNAYESMFEDCINLQYACELPAPNVYSEAYKAMFKGCTGLRYAPTVLPALIPNTSSYESMFEGCESLTSLPVLGTDGVLTKIYQSTVFKQMFKCDNGFKNFTIKKSSTKPTLENQHIIMQAPSINDPTKATDVFKDIAPGITSMSTGEWLYYEVNE